MSDTTAEGGRRTSTDTDAYRLEQILRSSARLSKQQDEPEQGPRLSRGAGSGMEPLTTGVDVQPDVAQPREQQQQVCQPERHVQVHQAVAPCSSRGIVAILLRQQFLCL